MRYPISLVRPVLIAAGALASIGSAQATTIVQTRDMTNFSIQSWVFNKFNPALGTLDSVEFSLSGSITTYFSFWNTGTRAATTSATANPSYTLQFGGVTYLSPAAPVTSSGPFNLGVGATRDVSLTNLLSASGSTTNLAAFTGSGTLNTSLRTITSYVNVPELFTVAAQSDNARVTLTYNYTPSAAVPGVPEPATWATMITGFGAIAFSMRRRKAGKGRPLAAAA